MKNLRKILAALVLLLPVLASAQNRFALIIGNGNYQRIAKLPNTINDAEDIAEALKKLGWNVVIHKNLDRRKMDAVITEYAAKLAANPSNEGFFWYAGHAVQIETDNYLIPTDVTTDSENLVRRDSYSLKELLSLLQQAGNKTNVVILDACRNNPFRASIRGTADKRGLSVVALPSNSDMFIMYSTQPEEAAIDGLPGKRNSPFTEAFLKKIAAKESLVSMSSDVINETLLLTKDQQRPYAGNSMRNKDYSLVSGIKLGGITKRWGTLTVHTATRGTLRISGPGGQETTVISQDYSSLEISEILLGRYTLTMTYSNGKREEHTIDVESSGTGSVDFKYRLPTPATPVTPPSNKPNHDWFWDIGVSLGTTFDTPAFIAAVHGSMGYSLFPSFGVSLEGGCDFGFGLLGDTYKSTDYHSFYPYIHANLLMFPISWLSFYGGLGGGLMIANYGFSTPYTDIQMYIPAMDFVIGFELKGFNFSLAWRTDFGETSFRTALGYTYRFR